MPSSQADSGTIALLRRLAADDGFTFISNQGRSDLMARNLRQGDVADAIVDWIDAGERVKPTVLHSFPGRQGDPAYEMKPKIDGVIWYLKVAIDDRGGPDEGLALLSAHPDH
jgi:hypothetical protein